MSTHVVAPETGRIILNGFVRFLLAGADTEQRAALVEHVVRPGFLAAPMHAHRHEDEYSFVLEGELSALIGDELVRAGPGSLVVKPRGVPHTFWNQGAGPLRLLEIISPAGFERYFDELDLLLTASRGQPDMEAVQALAARYGVAMDFDSLAAIAQQYGVTLGGPAPGQDPSRLAQSERP